MARIVEGGLDDPRVISLLHLHVTRAHAETAPGSGHAFDLAGLKTPDITFWSAWDRDVVLGVGALKRLAADHGEVKSMHTAEVARRRGIGSIMLRHIVDHAKAHGMARLSLETGSWDYFRPARAPYQSHGFVVCGPFAPYVLDPASVFMTRDLTIP